MIRALIVDYGGVLTPSLREAFGVWTEADNVAPADFETLLRRWVTEPDNPMHRLETGAMSEDDFGAALADALPDRTGAPLRREGLLDRVMAGLVLDRDSLVMLQAARAAGLKTALLSNSWAMSYPWVDLDPLLDVRVVSGEVGLRKPDPAIYHLAVDELGLQPHECAFVDDLEVNVRAARELGMVAVLHTDLASTLSQLARAVPAMAAHLPLVAPEQRP